MKKYILKDEFEFNTKECIFRLHNAEMIQLTPMQADILAMILETGTKPLKLSNLIEKYYGSVNINCPEISIMSCIKDIKKKNEYFKSHIKNVRKRGYVFDHERIEQLVVNGSPILKADTYEFNYSNINELQFMLEDLLLKHPGKKIVVGYALIE